MKAIQKLQASLNRDITELGEIGCTDLGTVYQMRFEYGPGPKKTNDDLAIMIPTRGMKPDAPLPQLVTAVVNSLPQSEALQVRLFIGVNRSQDQAQDLQRCIYRTQKALEELTFPDSMHRIIVHQAGYTWSVQGHPNRPTQKQIPFGEIRNHLFQQMTRKVKGSPILISMDGDTSLSASAIQRAMALEEDSFTTAGHLPDREANQGTKDAFKLHWELQAELYRRCRSSACQGQNISLGYPSEPCLIVGKAGFKALQRLHENGTAIFGKTDCEGRYLARHLQGAGLRFRQIEAPVATLHNWQPFAVGDTQIDDLPSLQHWLSHMAGQRQSLMNLDFFTRQLAYALSIPEHRVRAFSKRLYVPTLLKQGLSLVQMVKLVDQINDQRERNKRFTSDGRLTPFCVEIINVYETLRTMYGTELSWTLRENVLRWSAGVAKFAINKCFEIGKSDLMSGRIAKEIGHGAQKRSASVAQLTSYQRANVMPRLHYPRLDRARDEAGPSSSSPAVVNPIDVNAGDSDTLSDSDVPSPTETNPALDGIEQAEAKAKRVIRGLRGLHKEIYELLQVEHFGETHLMTAADIQAAFVNHLCDPHEGMGLTAEQINRTVVIEACRDLLYSLE